MESLSPAGPKCLPWGPVQSKIPPNVTAMGGLPKGGVLSVAPGSTSKGASQAPLGTCRPRQAPCRPLRAPCLLLAVTPQCPQGSQLTSRLADALTINEGVGR